MFCSKVSSLTILEPFIFFSNLLHLQHCDWTQEVDLEPLLSWEMLLTIPTFTFISKFPKAQESDQVNGGMLEQQFRRIWPLLS